MNTSPALLSLLALVVELALRFGIESDFMSTAPLITLPIVWG